MSPLKINRQLMLPIPPEQAFKKFIYLQDWWPAEYTWSKAVLKTVSIEQKVGGFFYEKSQQGFRLDWGTVIQWTPNKQLVFLWQVAPGSIPEPNPEKASTVQVDFIAQNEGTLIEQIVSCARVLYPSVFSIKAQLCDIMQKDNSLFKTTASFLITSKIFIFAELQQ